MIASGYKLVGEVVVTVTEADGTVVSKHAYNKITNYAMQSLAKWLSGISTASVIAPTRIGAGNGTGTVAATDTALWSTLVAPRNCDSIQISQGYYAQFNLAYQTTDPAGYYNELGLFDTAGNMWAHVAINQYKSTSQTLTAQWMIYMVADTTNPTTTITNFMRSAFAKWMAGTTSTTLPAPTSIQLGTGSGTPQASDSALWTPSGGTSKACDMIYIVQTYNVQFAVTYLATDPTGTFTECGWVDGAGNLWAHGTINATKTGTNLLSIVGQVGIVGD